MDHRRVMQHQAGCDVFTKRKKTEVSILTSNFTNSIEFQPPLLIKLTLYFHSLRFYLVPSSIDLELTLIHRSSGDQMSNYNFFLQLKGCADAYLKLFDQSNHFFKKFCVNQFIGCFQMSQMVKCTYHFSYLIVPCFCDCCSN